MGTYLQFELNGDIKSVLDSSSVPGSGPALPSDFVEVTDDPFPPGVTSWEEVLGWNYDSSDGSYTPPPVPPPTQEETELSALIVDDALDKTDMQALFVLPIPSWTQPDRDSAAKMSLRKLEITRLQTIVDKQ